jgi:hypothetical protein
LQAFLEQYTNEKDVRITGVLFNPAKYGVSVLMEAPTAVLMQLLRWMKEDSEYNIYTNARVLSLTEEVTREYSSWALRAVPDLPRDEFAAPKDWLLEVFETLKGFLELGRELKEMSTAEAVEHVRTSEDFARSTRIPGVDKIRGYAKCTDLCSVEEYLGIYDVPVECTLEGELIWPVDPSLKY